MKLFRIMILVDSFEFLYTLSQGKGFKLTEFCTFWGLFYITFAVNIVFESKLHTSQHLQLGASQMQNLQDYQHSDRIDHLYGMPISWEGCYSIVGGCWVVASLCIATPIVAQLDNHYSYFFHACMLCCSSSSISFPKKLIS